ncbi:MAG: hypothetical protein IIA45_13910 [Bacteroidetes bacterium]|nr:hypothetical protein [Bacteroidota bacterium]
MVLVAVVAAYAQCPMCKGIAESSLKEGSNAAAGLNAGILMLFAAPYTLIAIIGFRWYKLKKREAASQG